jgi:hypothetical protein
MAAKAPKKKRPVSREAIAHPDSRCRKNTYANTRVAPISPKKPIPPAMKCRGPCQLIEAGGPGGVPGGKPSIGSATKIPAPISPTPYTASKMGPAVPPRPGAGCQSRFGKELRAGRQEHRAARQACRGEGGWGYGRLLGRRAGRSWSLATPRRLICRRQHVTSGGLAGPVIEYVVRPAPRSTNAHGRGSRCDVSM